MKIIEVDVITSGARLLIPKPREEDEKIILQNNRNKEKTLLDYENETVESTYKHINGEEDSYLYSDLSENGKFYFFMKNSYFF